MINQAKHLGYVAGLLGQRKDNPYPRYSEPWHDYEVGYAEGSGERKRGTK